MEIELDVPPLDPSPVEDIEAMNYAVSQLAFGTARWFPMLGERGEVKGLFTFPAERSDDRAHHLHYMHFRFANL